ncbi:hypothetical protein CMK12_03735 [Candidatus Poribacteria bacterium]|jgi:hypothetical protein|nr:hypothetical protein [Candidatus Poribacteria bacterium]MDP6595904.1 glycosyl hydrolase family 28-related protein [Candidatus Poribacteria bacterium]MDP6747767.1 glycosyl hydrolase family 28-related protein [Candidatus Poribacteria bacterium]MDP6996373.1 glycosyl hydrolase family 28-related protein [Candidatus Poribacteria bacterium]
MNILLSIRIWAAILFLVLPLLQAQNYSELWGEAGEKWSPTSRLPDFSFAGYHSGKEPIPTIPQVTNIKSYGAKGDGQHDDSQAFLDAIAATDRGAIFIPAGRYKISQILEIKKSGIVLRGAGPVETVLFFPVPLNTLKPNMGQTTSGRPTSNYSWSGGMIWVKGRQQGKASSQITSNARRGQQKLTVSQPSYFHSGQQVEIRLVDDPQKTLLQYLYAGDTGDTSKIKKPIRISMVCQVVSITGDQLTIDRPLRFDVRSDWQPEIRHSRPTVTEVGIEHLTIEFPVQKYSGHFTEQGYNAIALNNVSNCWVRQVGIINADSGVYATGRFCTLKGITLRSERGVDRGGTTGHHGVQLGSDNLFTDFDFQTQFIHDITLSYRSAGNVCSNGRGVDLSLDHHKKAPYENLFSRIDLGVGTRIWKSGGGRALGKHCAARGTFWNIRAKKAQRWPPKRFGPQMLNLIGVQTSQPSETNVDGKWFEAIDPAQLHPPDLHQAQLKCRLNSLVQESPTQ